MGITTRSGRKTSKTEAGSGQTLSPTESPKKVNKRSPNPKPRSARASPGKTAGTAPSKITKAGRSAQRLAETALAQVALNEPFIGGQKKRGGKAADVDFEPDGDELAGDCDDSAYIVSRHSSPAKRSPSKSPLKGSRTVRPSIEAPSPKKASLKTAGKVASRSPSKSPTKRASRSPWKSPGKIAARSTSRSPKTVARAFSSRNSSPGNLQRGMPFTVVSNPRGSKHSANKQSDLDDIEQQMYELVLRTQMRIPQQGYPPDDKSQAARRGHRRAIEELQASGLLPASPRRTNSSVGKANGPSRSPAKAKAATQHNGQLSGALPEHEEDEPNQFSPQFKPSQRRPEGLRIRDLDDQWHRPYVARSSDRQSSSGSRTLTSKSSKSDPRSASSQTSIASTSLPRSVSKSPKKTQSKSSSIAEVNLDEDPFFEEMPGEEIWHRRMPMYFPFGETPFMEKYMSDQIDADLNREKVPQSPGVLQRVGKAVQNSLGKPKEEPREFRSPWTLPDVDPEEIRQAIRKEKAERSSGHIAQKRKASGSVSSPPKRRRVGS